MPSKASDMRRRVCDAWYNVSLTANVNIYAGDQEDNYSKSAVIKAKYGLLNISCKAYKRCLPSVFTDNTADEPKSFEINIYLLVMKCFK